MPSSYLNCFFDGNVPIGNSGNFRPEDYNYEATAERLKVLLDLNKDCHVLDLGCGNGLLTDKLIPIVKKLTLVEANPALVGYLSKKYEGTDVRVVLHRSDNLKPMRTNNYDRVICSAVLQYCNLSEAQKSVAEAVRVCKVGGLVYFGDVFDSTLVFDDRDGMASFDPEVLCKGYTHKVIPSNYEPHRRYDLIVYK